MTASELPELPYPSWRDTLATLHRFSQIVGKVRLAAAPRRNHWWNVPLHLTGRGLTTRPMGRSPIFTVDLDLVNHRLEVTTTAGAAASFALPGLSVAQFYTELTRTLQSVGVDVAITKPYPYHLPDSARPFTQDIEHAAYDTAAVRQAWQILSWANLVFEEFAAEWSGKTSPVHLFWHSFDLALTRFADRRIEQSADTDAVTREAYSREVISSGFWFGDDSFPEPAFYSYTAPEPAGLTQSPLRPEEAQWNPSGRGHLAVLRYADVRTKDDPRAAVLDFLDSAYRGGAELAGWDVARDAAPGGVTDPLA